ncbi:HMG (high mobility group) box domain-containing protein [Cardiosporidium cionae]|uniref:HMG (High mobility group) box domain-containing protein n=1 Tax=Cardiosporidium cionae TaxID=476202 RepID=A0ABQ7JEM7_9APIC|nr:HMG (high mobility group) box domain-containing protein [Cardiosporidium cionae]|eukprot:KAF8822431.1 HMG (high mobility group) box domain-containing protein [Cardiosporidium cionae]
MAVKKSDAQGLEKGMKRETKKRRPKRDPNAPKRSLSAYMFFAKDERERILGEHPHLKANVAQVGKMIGEAWNKLNEFDKAPYDKLAAQDKLRYESEKKIYLSK